MMDGLALPTAAAMRRQRQNQLQVPQRRQQAKARIVSNSSCAIRRTWVALLTRVVCTTAPVFATLQALQAYFEASRLLSALLLTTSVSGRLGFPLFRMISILPHHESDDCRTRRWW